MALTFLIATTSRADISLPLQGYYRTARYMPVHVDPSTSLLTADGVIPTVVESKTDAIVPVLIAASPQSLGEGLHLKPLADDERLIAFDGDTGKFAQSIFPNQKIIAIEVNPSDPLPGLPVAWEALDAIILDLQGVARLSDAQRCALLAAGVVLAVPGDAPPDTRWPWKRRNAIWILRYRPAGPVNELFDPAVFSPTYAWAPGTSPSLRRQILVAAVLLGIVVLGMAMWRSKAAVAVIVVLSVISTAAIVYWRGNLEIVNQAGGDIVVASDSLLQKDSWLYERAHAPGIRRIEWSGSTHPFVSSIAQLRSMQWRLVVDSSGKLAFEYTAMPGETVAFMRRDVRPGSLRAINRSDTSPMGDLARDIYLAKGDRLAGEQSVAGRWDTVIIEKPTPVSDR